jgi:excisionase family DNA binding protein
MNENDALLSSIEAAARLGVSQARVRQLAIAGDLPARKMGRDWFIRPSDLAVYQAQRLPVGRPRKQPDD